MQHNQMYEVLAEIFILNTCEPVYLFFLLYLNFDAIIRGRKRVSVYNRMDID